MINSFYLTRIFLLMRIIPFVLSALITVSLILVLDRKWGDVPPVGRFLSPQQGFWQNAEQVDGGRTEDIRIQGVRGKVSVFLDERLVPHVFAENDEDAYFVQGFLHAKYRLWQMELQTFAAAGRISEKMGNDPAFINHDREQRRSGMVYAARNALTAMEADPTSKMMCDSYTAGVNAYISSLTAATLPLEYKLLDYKPEPWSNLKIALFLKQMSKTLADQAPDLLNSMTKSSFSFDELMKLDPEVWDSLVPIIPRGTHFDSAGIIPVKPSTADSLYFGKKDSFEVEEYTRQDPNNGSNNWVVSGKKTKSGASILCNDPHLELSLPSIWYEMQISTPTMNVYGVSFPGSPSIVIGFNDHIAWGVTNSQRDVKDYYEIQYRDESRTEYWYNGQWQKTDLRVDTIKIKGGGPLYDTVAYTVFGPVLYDASFAKKIAIGKAIAVRWTAHDPSNEGLTFYKLNRAKDYADYLEAIKDYTCPGQNFVFGSKQGDIAIWQQGKFPARWYGQGLYVMPGVDSSYLWQGYIPQQENPHAHMDSGFLQSANQRAVDSSYPYFIPGSYINARGMAISRKLSAMENITPDDMMALQNDTYSVFAEGARGMLLKYVDESKLDPDARNYLEMLRQWDLRTSPDAKGATVYQTWFDSLEKAVWMDEWKKYQLVYWSETKKADSFVLRYPEEQTLLEWINRDSAFRYIDDISTPDTESIYDVVTAALQKATPALKNEEAEGKLEWARSAYKDPLVHHLIQKLAPFSRKVQVGGWGNTINAVTHSHGPSWRMIVHLTSSTEAYGIYPGGQSGNPGSYFYDNMIDDWAHGRYKRLWMMKADESQSKRIIGTLTFTHS